MKNLKILTIFSVLLSFLLVGCNGKFPGADARKYPADPKKRVEQNMARGEGFKLMDSMDVASPRPSESENLNYNG